MEQLLRGCRHLVDRARKRLFVRLGRLGEAAQFSNELKRRRPNLLLGGWRCKVVQCFDVSTHKSSPSFSETIKMRPARDSNTAAGSLASTMFALLLRQPLVKFWSIIDIENGVIASRQDSELRMAARRFHGANQFLHFFQRRELIVRPLKQPERNGGQLRTPCCNRADGRQGNDRSETCRHFVSGIKRSAPTHAVSSHVDTVRIDRKSTRLNSSH